MVHTAQ